MSAALIVMARYPTPGQVKTRLARTLGAINACVLYQAFLHDLDARLAARAEQVVWAFDPPNCDFAALVSTRARCVPQEGDDLGARMRRSFETVHAAGFYPLIMIGADCPHLRDEWIDEAWDALARTDIVLGPSEDGGYYLIGMRQPRDLFTAIRMGTPTVCRETLDRIATLNLSVHLLPPTFDVDEGPDVRRLQQLIAAGDVRSLMPETARVLSRISLCHARPIRRD